MIACSWCGNPARWIGHHNSGHDVPLCHPCALALRRPAIVSWTTVPLTDEQAADPEVRRQEWSALTTCIEHAYGTTARLSFQIKVF